MYFFYKNIYRLANVFFMLSLPNMKKNLSIKNFINGVVLIFAIFAFSNVFAQRQKISLDGEWDFSLIEADGSQGQSGKINVPGAWDAQGYGKATEKVHNNFIGIGRYSREIEIPAEWGKENSRINLVLEGVSRYADVWINGKNAGKANGLTGSHRLNVKRFFKFGKKNTIQIEVDSRQRKSFDAMLGAAQLNDYMEIAWGGLYGHVYLEKLPEVRLDNIYIRTRIDPATIVAECTVAFEHRAKKPVKDDITFPLVMKLDVFDSNKKLVASKKQVVIRSTVQNLEVPVSDAKLWTPENPNLYLIELSLLNGEEKRLDSFSWRVGIKELKTVLDGWGNRYKDRTKIFLNGKPLYLRGYGDDHIYLKDFAMPADKQMYIDRLKKIKALGFNHVRHHSTIMPPEYFEACDEVGMLPNAEFTIGYPWQMPNTKHWRKFAPAGDSSSAEWSLRFYRERFRQVVKDYRNYTCIFSWIGGNEIYMGDDIFDRKNSLMKDFMKIVRNLDPDRFFTDTDGEWENYMLDVKNDRESADIYYVLFDEWADFSKIVSDKYDTNKSVKNSRETNHYVKDSVRADNVPQKPVISHETANFTTFTRPDVVSFFEGSNFKPFWLTDSVKKLEKLGLLEKAKVWALASEKFCTRLHKHNIEAIRKQPYITGYHWWLIQDYWTSSDGIFDFAFRQKEGYETSEIVKFNAPTVLLQNGLKFAYQSGDVVAGDIVMSNYGEDKFVGDIVGEIKTSRAVVAKFDAKNVTVNVGQVVKCAEFKASAVGAKDGNPQKFDVSVSAISSDKSKKAIINDWSFWVFPKKILPPAGAIFADDDCAKKIPSWWNAKVVKSDYVAKNGEVLFTSNFSANVKKSLENGAKVVLLNPDNIKSYGMKYKPQWWRAGGSEHTNYVGGYIEKSSPLSALAPEGYCVEALAPLLENSSRFDIDSIATKPENSLRAMSSLMLYKEYSSVFRAKIGNGILVVSGLSHASCKDSPVNAWLLKTLLSSEPKEKCDFDLLDSLK